MNKPTPYWELVTSPAAVLVPAAFEKEFRPVHQLCSKIDSVRAMELTIDDLAESYEDLWNYAYRVSEMFEEVKGDLEQVAQQMDELELRIQDKAAALSVQYLPPIDNDDLPF